MSNEDINLIKLKIKLDYQKKQELKSQILKSIVQNKKVVPTYRLYAFFLLKKRKNINYKFKHICLKTGKSSSIYNKFFLSRFVLKNLALENKLQNLKIDSW